MSEVNQCRGTSKHSSLLNSKDIQTYMQIDPPHHSQLSPKTLSLASSAMDSSLQVAGQKIWQHVNNAATDDSSKYTDIYILIYTHLSRSINLSSSSYNISITVNTHRENFTPAFCQCLIGWGQKSSGNEALTGNELSAGWSWIQWIAMIHLKLFLSPSNICKLNSRNVNSLTNKMLAEWDVAIVLMCGMRKNLVIVKYTFFFAD